jgi:hypothetical protein
MYIYSRSEVDPDLDYQLVAHDGLLELYVLGKKTECFQLGEIVICQIREAIDSLTDFESQSLIQKYCDTVSRLRSRGFIAQDSLSFSLRSSRSPLL